MSGNLKTILVCNITLKPWGIQNHNDNLRWVGKLSRELHHDEKTYDVMVGYLRQPHTNKVVKLLLVSSAYLTQNLSVYEVSVFLGHYVSRYWLRGQSQGYHQIEYCS